MLTLDRRDVEEPGPPEVGVHTFTQDHPRPAGTPDERALEEAVAQVERRHGRPLPMVRLDRRPAAATALQPAGALAAAHGSTVVLPLSAGPLTGQRARGLLAHELTHVAQHLAGTGPSEATEQQARRAEAAAGGRTAPLAPTPPLGLARPQVEEAAPHALQESWTQPAPRADRPPEARPADATASTPAPVAAPATTTSAPAAPPTQLATPDPVRAVTASAPRATAPRPLDQLSRADLDELASRLYPRLRSELRHELLSDRDRISDLIDLGT